MSYTVKKNLMGQHRILYKCGNCQNDLDSPLIEAGQRFRCPSCGGDVITPGRRELEAQREAETAKLHREKAEAAARSVADQSAARAATEAAEVQRRRADQDRKRADERRERAKVERAAEQSVADRFLVTAFKVAKVASVLVIAGCLLAVMICLIGYVRTAPKFVPTPAPALAFPSAADYQRTLRPAAADVAAPAGGGSPSAQVTPFDGFEAIVRPFGLDAYTTDSGFFEYPDTVQRQFIQALALFVKPLNADQPTAIRWFVRTFNETFRDQQRLAKDNELARQLAAAAADRSRQEYLVFAGVAVAALLGFLFLPLLIQIEQTTRRNLILQAAMANAERAL